MQVRCPHCHAPIDLPSDTSLSDITCPSCGSSFGLLGEDETASFKGTGTKTLGHFGLIEQMGVGSFGCVWRARDTELDRTVAVKIPRKGKLDFGLARREAGEVTMTVEGRILGTPAYMSPEQAKGEAHQADRRSDVSSLGVILFELLTGERPFRGSARMLLHQLVNDETPSPRKLRNTIPRDLETVCLKCLEKDPSKRYQTAELLAGDLRCFLQGQPTKARPITLPARVWRWCKRNRVVAGSAALGEPSDFQ